MTGQTKEKFNFESNKAYEDEDLTDAISNLMPQLLLYSTDPNLNNSHSAIDILETALNQHSN